MTIPNALYLAATAARWTARIAGTLLFLFFLAFFFGEGPPNIFRATARENALFLGMAALFIGLILAWKWEAWGGLLSVAGFVLMAILERNHLGMPALRPPAVVGVVHIVCWWGLRATAPPPGAAWANPFVGKGWRMLLLTGAAALGVFVLLCANEMFGNPPLMTAALNPGPDLAGTWRARVTGWLRQPLTKPLDIVITIHPDASVSGTVGPATLLSGRIFNNRSWFGELMHWRADYGIQGRLSEKVQICEGLTDTRFNAGLVQREHGLEGAIPTPRGPLLLAFQKQ
jgi:hypothetical protein